jgi:hypothetical protein
MSYQSIQVEPFESQVTLGEAYRVMMKFLSDVEHRGPGTDLAWVIHSYAGVTEGGRTTDPASAEDFLEAV